MALVERFGDVTEVLNVSEPQKKADLYESLGLILTYLPRDRKVLVEADLSGVRMVRVGGPKSRSCHPDWRVQPWPSPLTRR